MTRIKALIAALLLLTFLPGSALPAEKSVIVRFRQSPGSSERALIGKVRGRIKRSHQLIPAMTVTLPEEGIAKLRKNRNVVFVEENAIYAVAPEPPTGNEYGNAWGVKHIFADAAHTSGNKGTGIKIAVLDTGIDYTHEDLAVNYGGGYDFAYGDNDPMDDNFFAHGTHVAGIIAAAENGIGVIGVAPEAELYAVKVLDGGGFGTEDWIIAGIEWAVSNQVDIINLSIQGPHSQGLKDACDAAYNAGVLLVAAGGNSLAGGGPVKYPAAYDSVVAVTATDASDVPGYFAPLGDALELSAPGVDILSTVAGGGYDLLSGTSQATPHVAGAAALYLLSNEQDLNGDGVVNHKDVRVLLQTTSTDLGDPGKDQVFGYGLVDVSKAAFPAEDEGGQDECDRFIDQLISYLLDQLLSRLGCGHVGGEIANWLESLRTPLSQFLHSLWSWKIDSARSIATMF